MFSARNHLKAFLAFALTGIAWAATTHLLPSGLAADIVLVTLGLGFGVAYLVLLLGRARGLLQEDNRLGRQVALLVLELLLMVSTFGLVYSSTGLIDNTGSNPAIVHSLPISLYYSVVTFTTLGYGDYYPRGIARVLAAAEATMGYLVLGIIASSAASVISPHNPAGGTDRNEE